MNSGQSNTGKHRKRSIIKKSILHIIVLGLFILIGVSLVSGFFFYQSQIEVYSEMANTFSKSVGIEISSDNTENLIKMPELTEYMLNPGKNQDKKSVYDKNVDLGMYWIDIDLFLSQAVSSNENLTRFQVVVPEESGLMVLWDERNNKEVDSEGFYIVEDVDFHRAYKPWEQEMIKELSTKTLMESFDTDAQSITKLRVHQEDGELAGSSVYPIFDKMGKKIIAYAVLDVSVSGIQKNILSLMLFISGIILVIMVIGILFYFYRMKKTLINPIVSLKNSSQNAVSRIKQGEKIFNLDIHTGDELEELLRSFEDMEAGLVSYIEENTKITSEKERVATELNMAAMIQSDMLNSSFPAFPDRKEFDIYASMEPAKTVGGDFYDFFFINEDTLVTVIADVSGKGIPASLFMMRSMLLIKYYARTSGSPAAIITDVNRELCVNNDSNMFVTVWLGILDLRTGQLKATNAGHEYPIIKKPGGNYELYKDAHGFALGIYEDMTPKEYEMTLTPGTRLLVYTDGATEAMDPEEHMIGTDGLLDAVNSVDDDTPEELLKNTGAEIRRFIGTADQFDDLTMLSLYYLQS